MEQINFSLCCHRPFISWIYSVCAAYLALLSFQPSHRPIYSFLPSLMRFSPPHDALCLSLQILPFQQSAVSYPPSEWLNTTEMYPPTVLEATRMKSKCQQDNAPSKICRRESSLALPSFWCFAGNPSSYNTSLSACTVTQSSSLVCLFLRLFSSKDASHVRTHPN